MLSWPAIGRRRESIQAYRKYLTHMFIIMDKEIAEQFIWVKRSKRQFIIIENKFCQFLKAKKQKRVSMGVFLHIHDNCFFSFFFLSLSLSKIGFVFIKNLQKDLQRKTARQRQTLSSKIQLQSLQNNNDRQIYAYEKYTYSSPVLGRTLSPLLIFVPTSKRSSTYTRYATNE